MDNRKKLFRQQYLPTCPHNIVNFGPLAAEIGSVVWGTQANFNGFRVLASLLHGIRAVAPAKLCRVEQRAPPIFGRAAITFGIGPHSSHYTVATTACSAVNELGVDRMQVRNDEFDRCNSATTTGV